MLPPPASSEHQRVSMAFRGGRSVLSLRRNQVASTDQQHHDDSNINKNNNKNDDDVIDLFQSHVADHLLSLSKLDAISLPFIRKLLESFLSCESHFRNLLPLSLSKPSSSIHYTDKPLSDLTDRFVKSLDIINDLTTAIHSTHHWNRSADIAASALSAAAGEAQLIRAGRALSKLLASSSSSSSENPNPTAQIECRMPERAWSFLSRNNSCNHTNSYATKEEDKSSSRTWSSAAAKQLNTVSTNLAAPRVGYEGVAAAAYTMSWMTVLVMRVLVAAFSGAGFVSRPVGLPRQVVWGAAMAGLEERVGEEWRRRGRRGKGGVLKEMVEVERCGKGVMEAVAKGDEAAVMVMERAAELGEAATRLGEGLGELEREVRVVFHRIVRCREEVIKWLGERSRSSTDTPFLVL